MYVAIEGVDTCGKSTQIQLLKAYYPQAVFTKEPGGSIIGEHIRDLVLFAPKKYGFTLDERAELMLFLADRAQHYAQVLLPHKDKLIISDRSVISGIAYAKSIDIAQSIALNDFVLRGMLPDLVVILELDEKSLKERIESKSHDNIESRGISYMLEIQKCFKNVVTQMNLKYIVLDATQDKERICAQIREHINILV
ncbi:dTMP kinase [Helicobacter sp. MIT 03-1614]|jgi:dTMP kinase|uniref:Thymidylate kinase n=1 Tax=Helicobacter hepaticus (strain ATCC 51449 / 3B1) TaxID=235279 RepID=KTHY_HELHP|nr:MULTISPECIES: dTMP kinase [Helicobacter]Q7VGF9.1 RecName: Full=Thymidylate kinase; AltName: Full=dTMP kinase [Helicobacter hepaticus ATCC 51449]AAP77959.1 thymidylate kinase [Helicobacter hepaticus ATCC 51449]TLD86616.1 dTMP kinase [Helicobacter sp. MIT 03-1614]